MNSQYRQQPDTTSNTDVLVLLIVGVFAVGGVITLAFSSWRAVVRWLIEHGIVVSPDGQPVVVLPSAGGAGLDGPRLVVLAAAVVGLLTLGAVWLRRRWERPLMDRQPR